MYNWIWKIIAKLYLYLYIHVQPNGDVMMKNILSSYNNELHLEQLHAYPIIRASKMIILLHYTRWDTNNCKIMQFLAERCYFIAMSGYCYVVCRLSPVWFDCDASVLNFEEVWSKSNEL